MKADAALSAVPHSPRLSRHLLIAWGMILSVLSMAPRAGAQAEVLVFLEDESPLRASFEVELAARGWRATFTAPSPEAARRTVERGAIGGLWLDRGDDGRVTLRAFRTDRGTSARLVIEDTDPRMIAVVAAAMLEELLSHHETLEPEVDPEPPPVRGPVQFPRPLGMYTAAELGFWLRLIDPPLLHAAARVAVGFQWAEGFRLGIVTSITGFQDPYYGGHNLTGAAGVETGVRLSEGLFTFHVGAHALVGGSAIQPGVGRSLEVLVGGYLGTGLWAYRRVELGVRITGEASINPSWYDTALLTLALHGEFR